MFSKTFTSRAGAQDISKLLLRGKDDLIVHAKAYDAMGQEVDMWGGNIPMEKKLLVIRL